MEFFKELRKVAKLIGFEVGFEKRTKLHALLSGCNSGERGESIAAERYGYKCANRIMNYIEQLVAA